MDERRVKTAKTFYIILMILSVAAMFGGINENFYIYAYVLLFAVMPVEAVMSVRREKDRYWRYGTEIIPLFLAVIAVPYLGRVMEPLPDIYSDTIIRIMHMINLFYLLVKLGYYLLDIRKNLIYHAGLAYLVCFSLDVSTPLLVVNIILGLIGFTHFLYHNLTIHPKTADQSQPGNQNSSETCDSSQNI